MLLCFYSPSPQPVHCCCGLVQMERCGSYLATTSICLLALSGRVQSTRLSVCTITARRSRCPARAQTMTSFSSRLQSMDCGALPLTFSVTASLLHSFTPSLLHSLLHSLHSLTHTAVTECTPWSKCGQGEQFSPGSLAADSTCSPCPAGSASGERHREREKFAYTVLNSLHFSHPDSNSMLPCCSPQERTRIPSHTRPQHAWIVTLGSSATRGQHVCSTHAQHHQSNALPSLSTKRKKNKTIMELWLGVCAPLCSQPSPHACACVEHCIAGCTEWSTCGAGELLVPGTTTEDRTCQLCPAGLYCKACLNPFSCIWDGWCDCTAP